MITLKSYRRVDSRESIATYTVKHSTLGRGGTTLELDLDVVTTPEGSTIILRIGGNAPPGNDLGSHPTVEHALSTLGHWLHRLGIAILERGDAEDSIPLSFKAPK